MILYVIIIILILILFCKKIEGNENVTANVPPEAIKNIASIYNDKTIIATNVKTNKLQLGDKWTLSGIGDSNKDDDWLRLMNKDGADYNGGFAAKKLWTEELNLAGKMNYTPNCRWKESRFYNYKGSLPIISYLDGIFNSSCDENEYLNGFKFENDGGYNNGRLKIKCCKIGS